MKIAVITYEFYPFKGGIGHIITSMCKTFNKYKENDLFIFNPFYKNKNIFKFPIKKKDEILSFKILKNKIGFYYFLLGIYKIMEDKNISFFNRLNMILYFFFTPRHTLMTIYNLGFILPIIKKLNVDLIFGASVGTSLTLSFLISRILKKKLVTLAHGSDFLIRGFFSFKSFYLKNLDKIILSNKRTLNLIKLLHNVDVDKLFIIKYAILLQEYINNETRDELRKTFNISSNQFVMLSVGRQIKRKNFDLVIRALYKILLRNPNLDIKYYLIGEGEETPKLKNLVNYLNLNQHVKFLGICDSETRNKFYKLSDLFIMPSTTHKVDIEGFGIVFLEANYYRLPVIGTKAGGIPEAITDNKTGLLVKPNDVDDLVEKILFLYNNPEIRRKMGDIGYKRVINDHSWDKIYLDYITLFHNLIN
ncbi:MAG: glycosyltransferase family 4 protein [Promethearchaeota archaeon]